MKIEYDKPIPPAVRKSRIADWSQFDKVKASAFFPLPKDRAKDVYYGSLSQSAKNWGNKQRPVRKFTVRHEIEDKVEGVRVWRTE